LNLASIRFRVQTPVLPPSTTKERKGKRVKGWVGGREGGREEGRKEGRKEERKEGNDMIYNKKEGKTPRAKSFSLPLSN
jgi:hypothetical protein